MISDFGTLRYHLLLLFTLFAVNTVLGQQRENEPDTLFIDPEGEALAELAEDATLFEQKSQLDPQISAIYSAVLPGLGQAYNKQYWKIPLIYAGGAIFLQVVKRNNQLYRTFRNALFNEIDLDPTTVSPLPSRFSVDALRRNTDRFRRDRDFFIIIGFIWYGLNIVDAHISAHLDEFNVNDELSMKITPALISVPTAPYGIGLTVTMNLKG